jgi:Mrp family chromosome partitioning ATPase
VTEIGEMREPARGPRLFRSPRWLKGLFGENAIRTAAVDFSDSELRRVGHGGGRGLERSQTGEEFRIIKRHVLANISKTSNPAGHDPRIILVASARPDDGKTFVALNLALSLALDRSLGVTLIDGDLFGKGLSGRLDLVGNPGLVDTVSSTSASAESFMQSTNIGNLRVLPVGTVRSDAPELLSGARMAGLLANLLARPGSQVVVIDSAALLSASVAATLASYAGQIIFVISANETRRSEIEEGLTLLERAIGPLNEAKIGIVLNRSGPSQSASRYSDSSAES